MTTHRRGTFVTGLVQVSPSAYVGSLAPGRFRSPVAWWRCNCGAANSDNDLLGKHMQACLTCGRKRPAK